MGLIILADGLFLKFEDKNMLGLTVAGLEKPDNVVIGGRKGS